MCSIYYTKYESTLSGYLNLTVADKPNMRVLLANKPRTIVITLENSKYVSHNRGLLPYRAPSASRAILNSLTAVGTSSKFNADIAHFACFCALNTDSSSVL